MQECGTTVQRAVRYLLCFGLLLCLADGLDSCEGEQESNKDSAVKLRAGTFVVVLLEKSVESHGVLLEHALAALESVLALLRLLLQLPDLSAFGVE